MSDHLGIVVSIHRRLIGKALVRREYAGDPRHPAKCESRWSPARWRERGRQHQKQRLSNDGLLALPDPGSSRWVPPTCRPPDFEAHMRRPVRTITSSSAEVQQCPRAWGQRPGILTRSEHSANDVSARFILHTPVFHDSPYPDPCPAPCNENLSAHCWRAAPGAIGWRRTLAPRAVRRMAPGPRPPTFRSALWSCRPLDAVLDRDGLMRDDVRYRSGRYRRHHRARGRLSVQFLHQPEMDL